MPEAVLSDIRVNASYTTSSYPSNQFSATSMLMVSVSRPGIPYESAGDIKWVQVSYSTTRSNAKATGLLDSLKDINEPVKMNFSYSFWSSLSTTASLSSSARRRRAIDDYFAPIVIGDPNWCDVYPSTSTGSASSQCTSSSNAALQPDTLY